MAQYAAVLYLCNGWLKSHVFLCVHTKFYKYASNRHKRFFWNGITWRLTYISLFSTLHAMSSPRPPSSTALLHNNVKQFINNMNLYTFSICILYMYTYVYVMYLYKLFIGYAVWIKSIVEPLEKLQRILWYSIYYEAVS